MALGNVEFEQLVGYVEIDETFTGGKAKNKHGGKGGGGQGGSGKAAIIGAVERAGDVIARAISSIDTKTVIQFVLEVASHKASLISTDEASSYNTLSHKERFPWGLSRTAVASMCKVLSTRTRLKTSGRW